MAEEKKLGEHRRFEHEHHFPHIPIVGPVVGGVVGGVIGGLTDLANIFPGGESEDYSEEEVAYYRLGYKKGWEDADQQATVLVTSLKTQIDDLHVKLSVKLDDAEIKSQLDAVIKIRDDYKLELDGAKAQLVATVKELDELKLQLDNAKGAVAGLAGVEKERDELRVELDGAKSQFAAELKIELDNAKAQFTDVVKARDEYKAELDGAKLNIDKLSIDNKIERDKLLHLSEQVAGLCTNFLKTLD